MYQAVEHRANLNPKQIVHFTVTGLVIGGGLGILIGHGITAFWRGAESFEYRRQLDDRESAIATLEEREQQRTEIINNFCTQYGVFPTNE